MNLLTVENLSVQIEHKAIVENLTFELAARDRSDRVRGRRDDDGAVRISLRVPGLQGSGRALTRLRLLSRAPPGDAIGAEAILYADHLRQRATVKTCYSFASANE